MQSRVCPGSAGVSSEGLRIGRPRHASDLWGSSYVRSTTLLLVALVFSLPCKFGVRAITGNATFNFHLHL